MAQETIRNIDKEYLETQFQNFATRLLLVFAKISDVPTLQEFIRQIPIMAQDTLGIGKPDGTSIKVDQDGTIHAVVEGGTMDYEDLINLPKINGNELKGEKSLHELGIQPEGDYLTESALEDYAEKDETGYSLDMSINPETFIIKLELKTKSGDVLSTQEIDLPLESSAVGIKVNNEEKTITLILRNGNESEPVNFSDFFIGLVSSSFTIAGIPMDNDITKEELQSALDVPIITEETENINFSTFFAS